MDNFNTKKDKNPLEVLTNNLDLLIDIEIWPEVKCDLKETLDDIRSSYSESLIEKNKTYLIRNLYLKDEPNIYYMRELDRVLNLTNASITRAENKLKNYQNITIETSFKEYPLHFYFRNSFYYFFSFYSFAKHRIKEIKELQKNKNSNHDNKPEIKHPFKDSETLELFNYIVDNWSNTNANRWGYIWEFFFTRGYGKITNQTEYENYIRSNHNFTKGKPNYFSCNSDKRYEELIRLYNEFNKI